MTADKDVAAALARVHEIAAQVRGLDERLGQLPGGEVEMSLLERATELAEEATRLLEFIGREAG
ncbi:MAG: hypothetical protein ACLQUT_06590 [Thermoleophilia bacterium]